MDEKKLWSQIVKYMGKKVSRAHLLTYFQDSIVEKIEPTKLVIATTNPFSAETIRNRYSHYILEITKTFLPEIKELELVVRYIKKEEKADAKKVIKKEENKTFELVEGISSRLFNPEYRLDNFIVGDSNELAFAVGKNVAIHPGKKYNPVFIHGGVGLGKTHLLQAIGNAMGEKHHDRKIIYTTTEHFTNECLESIGKKNTERFRNKYRKIDMLIIDDIQFLEHKERTQEEFFNTFNVLFDNHKQIIISSDNLPQNIKGIADRLVSRFQSGMIVEINEPKEDTRFAILQKKAQEKGHIIGQDLLHYVAENFEGNIRDMVGVLTQIIARVELSEKNPSLELVENLVKLHSSKGGSYKRKNITPEKIIQKVSKHFGISRDLIKGKERKHEISDARHVAMYIIRKECNKPYEEIGDMFSGRNHASVIHALKKITEKMQSCKDYKKEIEGIIG